VPRLSGHVNTLQIFCIPGPAEPERRMRQNVSGSQSAGAARPRPAKHKHDWGRRSSTLGDTLGSRHKGGLCNQPENQFLGFSSDKSSFLSYCYKSPSTTSIDSSFSSSSVGDGLMVKRPYRMMSNINFEDQQKITGNKRAKKSPMTPANSYERLFGRSDPRPVRPAQLTLFNKEQTEKRQWSCKQKRPSSQQLPVSPITGHVIGKQNLTFVQSPTRSVRSPSGSSHSALW